MVGKDGNDEARAELASLSAPADLTAMGESETVLEIDITDITKQ